MNVLSRVFRAHNTTLRQCLIRGVTAAAASTLMVLGVGCASASTITATSTSGAISQAFTGNWYGLTDASSALATISWSSGPNGADGKSFCNPPCPFGPEPKFTKDTNGALAPRTFAGFSLTSDAGPLGSKSITKGSGASQLGNTESLRVARAGQAQPLPNALQAKFTLTADGSLGTAAGGLEPSWVSTATGTDPWYYLPGDFQQAGISGNFDLFVPLELDQASFSSLGSAELSASYQSASGVLPLLEILLNSSGPTVTPGAFPGLEFYDLVPDTGGNSATYQQVGIATMLGLLQSDLSDGSLSGPLSLGVLVPNLPLPTVAIDSNGAVAALYVTATTDDAAVGPEPSTWILMLGSLALIGVRYCGKRPSGDSSQCRCV